jgi:hypothetical protein
MSNFWMEFLTLLIRENREHAEKASKDAAGKKKPGSHRAARIYGWLLHHKRSRPAPKERWAG